MLPRVHWTIDSLPVDLADWRCNVVAQGGFAAFNGLIRESIARRWPSRISQGARVTGYEDSGAVVYEGTLDTSPAFVEGIGSISASGPKIIAESSQGRLPYQIRDYSLWAPSDADPYGYGNNNSISGAVEDGDLFWQATDGTQVANGDRTKVVLWVPGWVVNRIAGTINQKAATNDYDLQSQTAIGPTGTLTSFFTQGLNGGVTISFDHTFASDTDDLVTLRIGRITAAAAGSWWGKITSLRVGIITTADEFTTDQVVADIGARCGYDTSGVQTSGVNAMPFDLNGNDWATDGLDYMAMLDDWVWLALEDKGLAAGLGARGTYLSYCPWNSTTWKLQRAYDAVPDLTPLPIYNQVVVSYVTSAGSPAQVSLFASPDPLSGTRVMTWTEILTDPQPDSTLATTVAANLLARYSVPRWQGSIDILGATNTAGGRYSPYAVLPGSLADLGDWGPAADQLLRIYEAERRPDGVSIGIEGPVTADGLIALSNLALARRT